MLSNNNNYCKTYYEQNAACSNCNRPPKGGFKYIESKRGVKEYFESPESHTLIFILSGKVSISCNEFLNVLFEENQVCLLPISSACSWDVLEDVRAITVCSDDEVTECDSQCISSNTEEFLSIEPSFYPLEVKPRLVTFLSEIKNFIDDGIKCPQMFYLKHRELSMLFKIYYPDEELKRFFLPVIKNTREFELFIMKNYMKMKGVKEFVNISGMNTSTFIRRFKEHFGETPYQWMIKQKSKHILHELSIKNRPISDIVREFGFSDASHFNRYCKAMFGDSPTGLRAKIKAKVQQH